MTPNDEVDRMRAEAVRISKLILSGDLDTITGARLLWSKIIFLPENRDEMFLIIASIDAQTDEVPLGEERLKYDRSSLEKLDRELAAWLPSVQGEFIAACQKVIDRYKYLEKAETQ